MRAPPPPPRHSSEGKGEVISRIPPNLPPNRQTNTFTRTQKKERNESKSDDHLSDTFNCTHRSPMGRASHHIHSHTLSLVSVGRWGGVLGVGFREV